MFYHTYQAIKQCFSGTVALSTTSGNTPLLASDREMDLMENGGIPATSQPQSSKFNLKRNLYSAAKAATNSMRGINLTVMTLRSIFIYALGINRYEQGIALPLSLTAIGISIPNTILAIKNAKGDRPHVNDMGIELQEPPAAWIAIGGSFSALGAANAITPPIMWALTMITLPIQRWDPDTGRQETTTNHRPISALANTVSTHTDKTSSTQGLALRFGARSIHLLLAMLMSYFGTFGALNFFLGPSWLPVSISYGTLRAVLTAAMHIQEKHYVDTLTPQALAKHPIYTRLQTMVAIEAGETTFFEVLDVFGWFATVVNGASIQSIGSGTFALRNTLWNLVLFLCASGPAYLSFRDTRSELAQQLHELISSAELRQRCVAPPDASQPWYRQCGTRLYGFFANPPRQVIVRELEASSVPVPSIAVSGNNNLSHDPQKGKITL